MAVIMDKLFSVIFDMDGIIFDSERACFECWKEAASVLGAAGIDEIYPRIIGTNASQTLSLVTGLYDPVIGEGAGKKLQELSSEIFHRKYDDSVLPLKPGVTELLEYLKKEGIKTALASSTRAIQVKRELGNAGLLGYFDSVTGGDRVRISKPDPEIYLIACDSIGSLPSDTFAVEDSFNGIRSAHAAGMRPLMVGHDPPG